MSTTPQRIQRKRTKGWKMPEGAVYVGRPTRWGNPFVVDAMLTDQATYAEGWVVDRRHAVDLFRAWLDGDMTVRTGHGPTGPADFVHRNLGALRGRDLACWCPLDQPCHADVLLELANHYPATPRRAELVRGEA